MPKLSINFEERIPVSHGKFEEQNMVWGPSIIVMFYCRIINPYYNNLYLMHSVISTFCF